MEYHIALPSSMNISMLSQDPLIHFQVNSFLRNSHLLYKATHSIFTELNARLTYLLISSNPIFFLPITHLFVFLCTTPSVLFLLPFIIIPLAAFHPTFLNKIYIVSPKNEISCSIYFRLM